MSTQRVTSSSSSSSPPLLTLRHFWNHRRPWTHHFFRPSVHPHTVVDSRYCSPPDSVPRACRECGRRVSTCVRHLCVCVCGCSVCVCVYINLFFYFVAWSNLLSRDLYPPLHYINLFFFGCSHLCHPSTPPLLSSHPAKCLFYVMVPPRVKYRGLCKEVSSSSCVQPQREKVPNPLSFLFLGPWVVFKLDRLSITRLT